MLSKEYLEKAMKEAKRSYYATDAVLGPVIQKLLDKRDFDGAYPLVKKIEVAESNYLRAKANYEAANMEAA